MDILVTEMDFSIETKNFIVFLDGKWIFLKHPIFYSENSRFCIS